MVRPVAASIGVTLGYRQKAKFDPNYIHRGIDYGAPKGTKVVATVRGKVVHAGYGGMGPAFGDHVVIKTDGIWHIYAHLSRHDVTVGQTVHAGQQVGLSGATGNVTGAHLHYGEFTAYWYKSDRKPRFVDVPAKPKPTPKPLARWFEHRHLNTWGDDGGEGTKTLTARLPKMVADLTDGKPEVITLNEVRTGHVAAWKSAFAKRGYDVVLAAGGNLTALHKGTPVKYAGTYVLPEKVQGQGRLEALGRVRAKVNGHWVHIGVTHLDYRPGAKFDELRVKQAKSAIAAMRRFAIRYALTSWKTRTSLALDENSHTWTRDKAFIPAGLKAVVKKFIDGIYSARVAIDTDVIDTASDHPIVSVTYGKKA